MSSRAAKWAAANGGSLNLLRLSDVELTVGVPAVYNILGATAGSTLTASGLPSGWTLNSAARTISGTPIAGLQAQFTLTETLAGKANSPKASTLALTLPTKLATYDPVAREVATFSQVADKWASARGVPTLQNISASSFRRTRAALGKLRAGIAGAVFVGIGDSLTRGTSAEAGNAGGSSGILAQMAKIFAGQGLPATADNVFGYGGYEQSFNAFDSRITVTGSFNKTAGGGIQGGGGQVFGAASAGTLVYAPIEQVSSFDIYYMSNGATFSWAIDGGAATNVVTTNNSTLIKLNVPAGTLGAHTLTISWVAGTTYIAGMVAQNTAIKRIDLLNMAWHGSRTQQWVDGNTTGWWNFDKLIGHVGADLVIWGLGGTNDWGNSVPVETYKANSKTLLNKVLALASPPDILVVTAPPTLQVAGAYLDQQKYIDAEIDLATELGLPVFDRWRSWGGDPTVSEPIMETIGAINTDKLHLTRAGHAMDAQKLVNYILRS